MPSAWEPDGSGECWSDREAWRGDRHVDDVEFWREGEDECGAGTGADETLSLELTDPGPEAEAEWPEDLAGPEYWLFKRYGL